MPGGVPLLACCSYGNGVGKLPAATNVGNFNDGSTNLGDWNT